MTYAISREILNLNHFSQINLFIIYFNQADCELVNYAPILTFLDRQKVPTCYI